MITIDVFAIALLVIALCIIVFSVYYSFFAKFNPASFLLIGWPTMGIGMFLCILQMWLELDPGFDELIDKFFSTYISPEMDGVGFLLIGSMAIHLILWVVRASKNP
ncbi:MAG: hypothetical protein LBO09_07435 [Candidatus Peribacteria bacterium]|jgi:hypothetical protein|nr:hypothetical protein [Candidatus Peribacteria bacterium]